MLADRRLIAVLGLSKGGTNHLAQCLHACDGVIGLTEGVSRMLHPSRRDLDQILTSHAIEAGVLKPKKPLADARALCVNKVNYTLVTYPEVWVRFLSEDRHAATLILLRNPFMIHRSRVQFVRDRKPQRTRWLDPAQLARELLELLAAAWRLPESFIVIHEHGLEDRHAHVLLEMGLAPVEQSAAGRPESCHRCGMALTRKPRLTGDSHEWLFCPRCEQFIEGEGHYNFLRDDSDVDAYRQSETDALDDRLARELRARLGCGVVEFFAGGAHWTDHAGQTFRRLIEQEADRWEQVPLNEILYPY